jgi:hypothetical protein
MVAELDNDRYFRWFDSGDMYALGLAEKILDVMRLTPWVNHWLPTRMHKFAKFARVIREMESLHNVVVRRSSDSILGGMIEGANSSTIIPEDLATPVGAVKCSAYERKGKCGTCRACWDKSVKVIAYPAHGQKLIKILKTEGYLDAA